MTDEWLTAEELVARFGLTYERAEALVATRTVPTRPAVFEGRPDFRYFSQNAVVEVLSAQMEAQFEGRFTYGQLADQFGIKRGWLDEMVVAKKIPPADDSGTYAGADVMRALASNPGQVLPPAAGIWHSHGGKRR